MLIKLDQEKEALKISSKPHFNEAILSMQVKAIKRIPGSNS